MSTRLRSLLRRAIAISERPRHGSSPSIAPPEPHRLIQQFQREPCNLLPSEQLSENPPGQRADLVELAGSARRGIQSAPASAARSAFEKRRLCPIARSSEPYKPLPCGTSTTNVPLGFKQSRSDSSTRFRIFHRFQHVHAQCAVELVRVHGSIIGGILRIELAHRHVRRPQKPIAQRVQIQRILFTGDVVQLRAIRRPVRLPSPAPISSTVSPRCGRSTRVNQLRYCGVPGQAVQQAAAVAGDVQIVDRARNTESRPAP